MNKSIYFSDSDAALIEKAASTYNGNLSQAIIKALREKYSSPQGYYMEVRILMSEKYLQDCAVKGTPAKSEQTIKFVGPVPVPLIHLCICLGDHAFLDMTSLKSYFPENIADTKFWFWSYKRDTFLFDVPPTLEEIIEIILARKTKMSEIELIEEKEQRESYEKEKLEKEKLEKEKLEKEKLEKEKLEKEKLEKEKLEKEKLKKWALENGSELLKARIEGKYKWSRLAREEYTNTLLEKIPLVEGREKENYIEYVQDCPCLEEIEALRGVRTILKDLAPEMGKVNSSLVLLRYAEDDMQQTEIKISVEFAEYIETRYYLPMGK